MESKPGTGNPIQQKYDRCLVMGGGGFRFGYYLGIFAAMQKQGKAPDLLLASCGGAIAAGMIQAFTEDDNRKEWLSSRIMYQFWLELQSSRNATIARTLSGVIKRRLAKGSSSTFPDLFSDYLFDIPQELPLPPPEQEKAKIGVAIIAGQLLYEEQDVNRPRNGRKLFAETVFCEQRAADLLEGMLAPAGLDSWGDSAVSPGLLTNVQAPIHEAVRASVSDMFLFRCHRYKDKYFTGGVIDLLPIEIANKLANKVILEIKGLHDEFISIPALRTVFGSDGNRRLSHVLGQPAHQWIDTSDMELALAEGQIQRQIVWRRNRIELIMPNSHDAYVKMIDAQWHYGYERTMASRQSPEIQSA